MEEIYVPFRTFDSSHLGISTRYIVYRCRFDIRYVSDFVKFMRDKTFPTEFSSIML